MTERTTPIAETNAFIILDKYTALEQTNAGYQTEAELERELLVDLQNQGYERVTITSREAMLNNVRVQLQSLNDFTFSDGEWQRFVRDFLDKASEGVIEKTRKIQENSVCDFVLDDGRIKNIHLLDKQCLARNKLQVLNQFAQTGSHANRYDVTILVNGLPLVHVELKKRGVAIREAFNQVHRYSKESFNSDQSLFKYVQMFVISNGTDTRYFANTTQRNKNSFDFTMHWARSDNTLIKDLKDFTATFFQRETLLNVLIHYAVFDVNDILLLMRPYQIAAAERILWKIHAAHNMNKWGAKESGGYIWHTTGSGKTLTSFKTARLATELDFIDKVFFVVDRKDLDYQTMREYQRFSPDSVNGSKNTAGLKKNIESDDNKIIVTTIQKLNNLMRSEKSLDIYKKPVVFIFDECHRSQFGEAQKNLQKNFKKFCQFGFTGTPILKENAIGSETTAGVFGQQLHTYVITDAIRDKKVLKFKVDYNDVRPQFAAIENEQNMETLSAAENKKLLLHPQRLETITQYILQHFNQKTRRSKGNGGFNAMFAVSSVEAAKAYYELFKNSNSALKVGTIFSFAANEEQAVGDIIDEGFEAQEMDNSSKAFLERVIDDYNLAFRTQHSIAYFENYYKDLALRVQKKEIDLLIVVGMFLTGFDAPTLNTLFVDKNLRYHGLIQAFSRTNRIFDATKTFGNIVTFRNLEQATDDAIKLFGNSKARNIVIEVPFDDYMWGEEGYIAVVNELQTRFPDAASIETEADKKAFVKLFGAYLRLENTLQNYDEFYNLQAMQAIDVNDPAAVEAFKEQNFLTDAQIDKLKGIRLLSEREDQDYRSSYNDIREERRREKIGDTDFDDDDWDEVVFEVDLLKSQEINLDYILELIVETKKQTSDKAELAENIRRILRSSLENRAKEALVMDFIDTTDLDEINSKAVVIDAFYQFAQEEQRKEMAELIETETLNEAEAKRYIGHSLKREYASDNGAELNAILPRMSPLNPAYLTKKNSVFEKISDFVEKFKGIGGV